MLFLLNTPTPVGGRSQGTTRQSKHQYDCSLTVRRYTEDFSARVEAFHFIVLRHVSKLRVVMGELLVLDGHLLLQHQSLSAIRETKGQGIEQDRSDAGEVGVLHENRWQWARGGSL